MNTRTEVKPQNWFVKHYLVSILIVVFVIALVTNDSSTNTTSNSPQNAQAIAGKTNTEMLQNELSQWKNEPLNADSYTSLDTIQLRALLYSNWANLIDKGEKSADTNEQKLAQQLKEKVIVKQTADFPVLRKAYAKLLKVNLFNEQVDDVTTNSTGNTTLTFIGPPFISNKFVSAVADASGDMVTLLRFKRAEYRWSSDYSNDYKYKTLDNFKDTDIVTTEKFKTKVQ